MSLIEVKGLYKSFGDLDVIKGIDLNIEEGERVAIIGESGCGKSVFLRSLVMLEKPDQGKICIDGKDITAKNANINQIRTSIGMVFQNFHLFSEMDVMDNLCLAPVKIKGMKRKDAEKKAMYLLEMVGLSNRAHSWPGVLSGGQKQRIAICRCLMMEPKLLLFDEATSALDPTMVGEVLAVIRMLAKRGMTMLIVTHEMNFARDVADRVLFFSQGKIYEEGSPEEIFDNPKKEKTIDFVNKIKYFSYEIKNRSFDLMQLQGGIQNFGQRYGLDNKETYRLQICCEELIYELINNCFKIEEDIQINLDITYAETRKSTQIKVSSTGKAYDPFSQEEDGLGITILKKMASKIDYERKNDNNIMQIHL